MMLDDFAIDFSSESLNFLFFGVTVIKKNKRILSLSERSF